MLVATELEACLGLDGLSNPLSGQELPSGPAKNQRSLPLLVLLLRIGVRWYTQLLYKLNFR